MLFRSQCHASAKRPIRLAAVDLSAQRPAVRRRVLVATTPSRDLLVRTARVARAGLRLRLGRLDRVRVSSQMAGSANELGGVSWRQETDIGFRLSAFGLRPAGARQLARRMRVVALRNVVCSEESLFLSQRDYVT